MVVFSSACGGGGVHPKRGKHANTNSVTEHIDPNARTKRRDERGVEGRRDDAQDPRLERAQMDSHKRKRDDVVAELGEVLKRAIAAKDLEGAR